MALCKQVFSDIISTLIRLFAALISLFQCFSWSRTSEPSAYNADNGQRSCPATTVDINNASETGEQLPGRDASSDLHAINKGKTKLTIVTVPNASDCSDARLERARSLADISDTPRDLSFPPTQPSKFQRELTSALSPQCDTLRKSLNGPKICGPRPKGVEVAGGGEGALCNDGSDGRETPREGCPGATRTAVKKALLIGVNSTRLDEKDRLRFAANDARRFADCLTKQLGFAKENICTLTDTDSEHEALPLETIMNKLNWLFEDAIPGDMLVLLISGHCLLNKTNNVVSLISVEEHGTSRLIPSTIFRSYFDKLPQGCTVEVVLDCCYSAGLIKLPHLVAKMDMGGGKSANVMSTPSSTTPQTSESGCAPATTPQEATDQPSSRGNVCYGIAEHQETPGRKLPHLSHAVVRRPLDSQPQLPPTRPPRPLVSQPRTPVTAPPKGFLLAPVQTQANVTVWAASGSEQRAFESSNIEGEPTNGVLTNAICKVIESFRSVTRRKIWEEICRITRLENLKRSEGNNLESQNSDQVPHMLSSHKSHERTMNELAFGAT